MKVLLKGIKGTWREIADAARTTIHMEEGTKEPSSKWKKSILLAEHSPIRKLHIDWKWYGLKSWISVHFTRHKIGIEHYVRTQRTDRTGIDRNELKQSQLLEHECEATAQAMINISRKRLCNQASKETKEAWREVLENIKDKQPELYNVCVPECIYRNGFCPEMKSCGWNKTKEFEEKLKEYIKDFEQQINDKTNIVKHEKIKC
jgi:hypothetical protein